MPMSVMTSKGQITIPKEIREFLHLKPADKVVIVMEKDHAILQPLRGNILDVGGTVKIPEAEKPIDFHKVRRQTEEQVAKDIVDEMR